jgi:hypothetical protein
MFPLIRERFRIDSFTQRWVLAARSDMTKGPSKYEGWQDFNSEIAFEGWGEERRRAERRVGEADGEEELQWHTEGRRIDLPVGVDCEFLNRNIFDAYGESRQHC